MPWSVALPASHPPTAFLTPACQARMPDCLSKASSHSYESLAAVSWAVELMTPCCHASKTISHVNFCFVLLPKSPYLENDFSVATHWRPLPRIHPFFNSELWLFPLTMWYISVITKKQQHLILYVTLLRSALDNAALICNEIIPAAQQHGSRAYTTGVRQTSKTSALSRV